MVAFALGLVLYAAQSQCPASAMEIAAEGLKRAGEFDLGGAADRFRASADAGCTREEVSALYLRGLADAREAFRQGGAPASLAPVRRAIASLDAIAKRSTGSAEIARLTLQAAAAAAQSERAEMRLYLEAALAMESTQRDAGQPGAPVITAAEAAGDLWLQVHQYEDARHAYAAAKEQVGLTRRVAAGLARAAARLNDRAAACGNYQILLGLWVPQQVEPSEIVEARNYLAQPACLWAARP